MQIGFLRLSDENLYGVRSLSILEPLGLEYLIGNINPIHSYKMWDLNVGDVFNDYADCDFICITVPTPLYNQAKALISLIHTTCKAKVVVGGPHPSALPEECISDLGADYVVVGEGESALEHIFNNTHNQIITGESLDINLIKFPTRYGNRDNYKLDIEGNPNVASMITSRSCPYQCIFCSSKKIFGNKLRLRSVDNVIEELRIIKAIGYNHIIFLDDTFTFDRARTMDMCNEMIANNFKFNWWVDTRVDKVDEELLSKMKEAGCVFIVYGIESGNIDILKRIKKSITPDKAREAIKLTKKVGIKCKTNFMLGHVDETANQMIDTINLSLELRADKTSFYQVIPLPGTEQFKYVKISSTADYDNFKWYGDKVPSICKISSEKLKEMQKEAYRIS